MANSLSPTAANIISSLGIKGAISEIPQGSVASAFAGFVPILNADGKIASEMISANAAQEALPALTNIAFVDQSAASDAPHTGSIVAPYRTVAEAAADTSARQNEALVLILSSGMHITEGAIFGTYPNGDSLKKLYIIGIGGCYFGSPLTIGGLDNGAEIYFVDIAATDYTVTIASMNPTVTCMGNTHIGTLSATSGTPTLLLSPESRVSSTDISNIDFLSDASHVKNTSSAAGATVADVLGRLDARKIKIAKITAGSSGFIIDGSSYVEATSDSGGEVYDLTERDAHLVEGINRYVKTGRDLDVDTLTAKKVTAETIEADELNISYLTMGGYRLEIDPYGYLVVNNSTESPVAPPRNLLLLEDVVTGIVYGIGIADGRAYAVDLEDESSSSSYAGAVTVLHVTEDGTGNVYDLTMEAGRLIIRPHVDS